MTVHDLVSRVSVSDLEARQQFEVLGRRSQKPRAIHERSKTDEASSGAQVGDDVDQEWVAEQSSQLEVKLSIRSQIAPQIASFGPYDDRVCEGTQARQRLGGHVTGQTTHGWRFKQLSHLDDFA